MKASRLMAAAMAALWATSSTTSAQDRYLGEVFATAASYCPQGTLEAQGQYLEPSRNQALFSLLGMTYGGDGRTTFALPNISGRTLVGIGHGPGLTPVAQGQMAGQEEVYLSNMNLPAHTHALEGDVAIKIEQPGPETALAAEATGANGVAVPNMQRATVNGALNATVDKAGERQPFSVRDPFLGIRYCIVMQGLYPARN